MIIPAYSHSVKRINDSFGVRAVTTKEGVYFELWTYTHNRPVKNGKIFMLTSDGDVILFKNINPKFFTVDKKTKTIKATNYI